MPPQPVNRLVSKQFSYDYSLKGGCTIREAELLETCVERFFSVVGTGLGKPLISKALDIRLDDKKGNNFQAPHLMHLNPRGLTEWTVTHELSHALDAAFHWQLSHQMREATRSGFLSKAIHFTYPNWRFFWYRVGSPPPPCGVDKKFNSLEDFAEALTAFIYPDMAKRKAEARGYPYEKWGYTHFQETPRGRYIQSLLESSGNQNAL